MSLYTCGAYNRILDRVINEHHLWREIKGKSFFVTGSTGLIGSGLCDLLLYASKKYELKLRVYAAGRSKKDWNKRFKGCFSSDNISFVKYNAITGKNKIPEVDYIIHAASPASPDRFLIDPVGTMNANLVGLREILDNVIKADRKIKVAYISSSEIYGARNSTADDKSWSEDEQGVVDILSARASYPMSKRAAETLCAAYVSQFKTDCVILRPGHIYGPTAQVSDARVSSSFAYMAAHGKDIVMKSDGSQIRSYVHVFDTAMAIIYALLYGKSGEAYNISNPDSVISIKQMTENLCEAGGSSLYFDIPSCEEVKRYNPMKNSSLDGRKLEALGYKAVISYKVGLTNTVEVLRENGRKVRSIK